MSASVWKKTKIKSISEVKDGTHGSFDRVDSGKPLLSCKNVFDNELVIEKKESFISEEDYLDIVSNGYPQKNDILISCVGSIGRCCIFTYDEPIAFQRSVAFIRTTEINPNFLMYRIQSDETQRQIKLAVNASAQGGIYLGSIERLKITYPTDISEQKHISDILSTCDIVIQNTQKTIEKYKAIKQGMMQDLFTRGLTKDGKLRPSYEEAPELYKQSELGMIPKEWEVKQLGECSNKPEYGLNTPAMDYDGKNGYLRITDIDDESHSFLKKGITSPVEYSEEYKLYENDLVFARTGASVGKTYLYNSEDGNLYFAGFLIRFRILDSFCAKYIYYNTLLPRYKNWVICYSMRTGQPGVNAEEFATYQIPIPQVEEQIFIAKRLSSIDSTIQKEESILAKYKNIKTGLMARLLTPPEDAQIIDETEE